MNNGFNLDSNSTQAFQGANFFNKSAFETPMPTKKRLSSNRKAPNSNAVKSLKKKKASPNEAIGPILEKARHFE